MSRLVLAALAYGGIFHFAYAAYVNPAFEYAHYLYLTPTAGNLAFTYLLLALPVLGYRSSAAPAAYGAALVFTLVYVPAQLILLFTWQRPPVELLLVQSSIAASMAILLRASGLGHARTCVSLQSERSLAPVMAILTGVSLVVLVITYREHMRLVSFEDVYDLRFESVEAQRGALADYLLSWLSYCFLPFYFARGVMRRRWSDLAIGLFGSVLIYAATGSKAAILMPAIIVMLNLLFGSGKDFLLRLVIALTASIVLIVELMPNEGLGLWVKSIVLLRVLGTGGWNMSVYYDYFTSNGFTFYSHIGPVNALTGAYPYGEYSLGQLIGLEYSGSELANFNANFWASDGFAALGLMGVPVVTFAVCAVFFAINRFTRGFDTRFVVLWLAGFWLALLNVPLTTALLSGGGALTLLLIWSNRRVSRKGRPGGPNILRAPQAPMPLARG